VLGKVAVALQLAHPEVAVKGLQCDVTNRGSVEELLSAVEDAFGGAPVVYLGANAGVLFPSSTVLTGSADEWNLTLQVNVLGVVNTLQTFVPAMLGNERDCCVVTTASIAGLVTGISGPVRMYFAERSASLLQSSATAMRERAD
jgi:NAD(P)-dependent dehydrogenase (short-subunit alcohol dehydrogenase family)